MSDIVRAGLDVFVAALRKFDGYAVNRIQDERSTLLWSLLAEAE